MQQVGQSKRARMFRTNGTHDHLNIEGKLYRYNKEHALSERFKAGVPNNSPDVGFEYRGYYSCLTPGCPANASTLRYVKGGENYNATLSCVLKNSQHADYCVQDHRSTKIRKLRTDYVNQAANLIQGSSRALYVESCIPIQLEQQELIEAIGAQNAPDLLCKIPSYENMSQASRRRKRKKNPTPQDPKTHHDVEVPEAEKLNNLGQPFMLYQNKEIALQGGELGSVIIFGNKEHIKKMFEQQDVSADATFKMCPVAFSQFWTMHFKLPGTDSFVPGLFVFMSHKTYAMYKTILDWLKEMAAEWEVPINFTDYHGDFELAPINAFVDAFPGILVHGCNFHLCQAIFTHLCEVGLKKEYQAPDDEFGLKLYVKRLMALAFLPADRIYDAFRILANFRPFSLRGPEAGDEDSVRYDKMIIFLRYMRDIWIKEGARFSTNICSVWTLERNRTNNAIEGWHNGIKAFFRVSHSPTFWVFLTFLRSEDSMTSVKIAQARAGTLIARPKRKYIALNQRLAFIKAQYKLVMGDAVNIMEDIKYLQLVADLMINF